MQIYLQNYVVHHTKLFYNIPTIVFQINMDNSKNQNSITHEISCTLTM